MKKFSFIKATHATVDDTVNVNIKKGEEVKILVPEEFGDGYLIAIYRGNGVFLVIEDSDWVASDKVLIDIYEVVAYWNLASAKGSKWLCDLRSRDYVDTQTKPHLITGALNCDKYLWLTKTYDGMFGVPVISDATSKVRRYGLDLTYLPDNHKRCEYPIKIVEHQCTSSYEEVDGFSLRDPVDGLTHINKLSEEYKKLKLT